MTDLKPNAALAYAVLDHIDAHPETWDQKHWCGTSQCFAGWTVALSGERVADPEMPYVKVDGQDIHVGTRAAQLLGFRSQSGMADAAFNALPAYDEEESDIFDSFNSRQRLGEIVDALFGPRPAPGGA